jgi:hypothetical protein
VERVKTVFPDHQAYCERYKPWFPYSAWLVLAEGSVGAKVAGVLGG